MEDHRSRAASSSTDNGTAATLPPPPHVTRDYEVNHYNHPLSPTV